MTWTLRLYDGDGVEVAWVTADPYEWSITYPKTDGRWDGLRVSLEGHERGAEALPPEVIETEKLELVLERVKFHRDTPQEHLEWVKENVTTREQIASASLTDE